MFYVFRPFAGKAVVAGKFGPLQKALKARHCTAIRRGRCAAEAVCLICC